MRSGASVLSVAFFCAVKSSLLSCVFELLVFSPRCFLACLPPPFCGFTHHKAVVSAIGHCCYALWWGEMLFAQHVGFCQCWQLTTLHAALLLYLSGFSLFFNCRVALLIARHGCSLWKHLHPSKVQLLSYGALLLLRRQTKRLIEQGNRMRFMDINSMPLLSCSFYAYLKIS